MSTNTENRPEVQSEDDSEAGFSLTEIMISVVIMGLLGTVVVLNVLPLREQASVQKARADIATLEQALDAYRLDMRRYPTVEEGLDALVNAPRDAENYREGGYIRRLPNDPWDNPYQYVYPGENGVFDIYSLGADGREGGEDNDADIGNWQG
ncbi:MAG: type II secretion system major pseudopilin GspG [Maricaulis sp.]|uniref:type II secretion system major pseudopilin GspG n=1 Tax=Maricaulis sp. TaxID=1486257 RepID=UPI002623679A|nr:type II secretion system major pseudopilin GspG [Maricaulis sp.]MDM7984395.1 type II secretion system major pseudopilin GspG [Maricaulis sp.]